MSVKDKRHSTYYRVGHSLLRPLFPWYLSQIALIRQLGTFRHYREARLQGLDPHIRYQDSTAPGVVHQNGRE